VGAPTTISGDADVSTTGSLVDAFNFGTAGGMTTVNGVSFLNVATEDWEYLDSAYIVGSGAGSLTLVGDSLATAFAFDTGEAPFSGLSDSYKSLLNSAVWNDSGASLQIAITIQGLTIGRQYQVQLWSNDPRSYGVDRDTPFDSVVLEQNTKPASDPDRYEGEGGLGQWVIGSFTADNTTRTIIADAAGASARRR